MIIKSAGVASSTPALVDSLSDKYRKAPLGSDLIGGRTLGAIAGGAVAGSTAGILSYQILKKWKSLKGKEGRIYLSNLMVNISTIMWDMMKFYFLNTSHHEQHHSLYLGLFYIQTKIPD